MVRRPMLLLIVLLLAACSHKPDETLIRQSMDEMVQAVEQHHSGPVLDHLAPTFHGPENMDTRRVRAFLAAQYFRNPKIHVILTGVHIRLAGDEADVVFHAAVAGGVGIVPDRAQYYVVTTRWRKFDGDWRVLRADWEPAGG